MPLARYQGVLTIPVFKAPYTVPNIPGPVQGLTAPFSASDWFLYTINRAGGTANNNGLTQYTQGTRLIRLQPSGAQNVVNGNLPSNANSASQANMFTMIAEWAYAAAEYQDLGNVIYPTFMQGDFEIPMSQSNTSNALPGINTWGSQAIANTTSAPNFASTPGNGMQRGMLQVQEIGGLAIPGLIYPITNASGSLMSVMTYTPYFKNSGFWSGIVNTGPLGFTSWQKGFFVPNRVTGRNMWWCVNNLSSVVQLVTLDAFFSILSGATNVVFGKPDTLTFDDPTINAGMAARNFSWNPTANGVWMQGGTLEYYLSLDGTKYWAVQYANYSGVTIKAPQSEPVYPSRFVDAAGTFWYAGSSTLSGSTIQPLYSIGINIPFNPVFLPQIPPLSLPCWSTCLNRIGGNPGELFNTV